MSSLVKWLISAASKSSTPRNEASKRKHNGSSTTKGKRRRFLKTLYKIYFSISKFSLKNVTNPCNSIISRDKRSIENSLSSFLAFPFRAVLLLFLFFSPRRRNIAKPLWPEFSRREILKKNRLTRFVGKLE